MAELDNKERVLARIKIFSDACIFQVNEEIEGIKSDHGYCNRCDRDSHIAGVIEGLEIAKNIIGNLIKNER